MVRLVLTALLLTSAIYAEDPSTSLRTECSKLKPYVGEVFTCHFVLYSAYNRLEVEVAKFPEFRGYWSENVSLRQGPMMLMPEPRLPRMNRAVIGSYHLTPLLGQNTPTIEPMRVVVRSPEGYGDTVENTYLSEPPVLSFTPLPPPPAADRALFKGAVGQFTLRSEAPSIGYFPKEPLFLRYVLQGSGNFAEINELPLQLPEQVTVLSQRSSSQGTGPFQTKFFEVSIAVDSMEPLTLPPLTLAYFNPLTSHYDRTESSPVQLQLLTRPTAVAPVESVDFGEVAPEPGAAKSLVRSPLFWGLQILLFLAWAACAGALLLKRYLAKLAADPWRKIKLRWKGLFAEPPTAADWCPAAEQLVFDTLAAKSPKPLRTRREAVAFAKRYYGAETAGLLKEVFTEWEESHFAPIRRAPPTRQEWQPRFGPIRAQLLARRPKAMKS